ncbi:MAG TPA: glycosyl hydrolase family 28-related protein, partial [archaeon]|nr:glycosyl hydrolase family 28-related protein [archaeon]
MNIRRILFAAGIIAAWTTLAPARTFAQGSRKDDIVFGPSGHPIAGATITVCTSTATGTPCSPLATIYTDATLTVPAANPFQSDGIGNYHFYAPAGRYRLQITGPGISGTITYPDVILPADLSSSGAGNNISAFGLTLGGNLTVGGNATISGTLTTANFSPGNFTPTSLSVLGNESVQGPRPRVDVTAFGAKGDGATDDTAAIQSAINQACSAGGSLYFPPGSYVVSQPQLPSTAAIFTPNCAIHIIGGNSVVVGTGQFASAPATRITSIKGSNPNNAPVFQFTHNSSTIENMGVAGYNQAIAFGTPAATTSNLRARNVTASVQNTSQANNCPYYLTATLFDAFEGSGGQSANSNSYIWCIVDTNSLQPVGLISWNGNFAAPSVGCLISYTATTGSATSGPGGWDIQDITTEACNGDLILLQNGGFSVSQITGLTLRNVLGQDSSCSTCALINLNASGTALNNVIIEDSSTNANGPAIKQTAGVVNFYQLFGQGGQGGNSRVVDTNGNPVGVGIQSNGNAGFDFISNSSDSLYRLNSNFQVPDNILAPSARWCSSGNQFCGAAADSAAGFILGDQTNFGYSAGVTQGTQGKLDIEFAQTMP